MRITLDGEAFELTADSVRDGLVGQTPEAIREYWVEIDGTRWPVKQVISLSTGVGDRQRFQSQSARRWLGNLGFAIGSDDRAERAVNARGATGRETVAEGRLAASSGGAADVVLIGCVKTKLSRGAPARELYVSDYFAKMRTYAERSGLPWFILSAEYGLVRPEQWIDPYERYLPDTSGDYRQQWSHRVASQCEEAIGLLSGVVVEVHAGAAYVQGVRHGIEPRGAHVKDPLEGLSFGRRLAWYAAREAAVETVGEVPPDVHPDATLAEVLARLEDPSAARSIHDFLSEAAPDLRVGGVYSWWVDSAGAEDLSRGLGHPVAAGLIYAGLAGATRVSGKASSNTLWGRIATMHLGKRHQFSTLRLSLGSLLAEAHGHGEIDEVELTAWMHAHLRVVTAPVGDVDSIDALESDLLSRLDPPLNLAKVAKTPTRLRLSALRRKYGSRTKRPDRGMPIA